MWTRLLASLGVAVSLFVRATTFLVFTITIPTGVGAQWEPDGVQLVTGMTLEDLRIVSDGSSGAIVMWRDARTYQYWQISAQHMTSAWLPTWTTNGVDVVGPTRNTSDPQAISDGNGGAIVIFRSEGGSSPMYAQRINASGTTLWGTGGVQLTTRGFHPAIEPDASGGAIIAWNGDPFVRVQRIDADGTKLWGAEGVTTQLFASFPVLAGDGAGGAFISSTDYGECQRIAADGTFQWPSLKYVGRVMTPDLAGGIFSVGTNGTCCWGSARHLTSTNVDQWGQEGILLQGEGPYLYFNTTVIADRAGGAIILWRGGNTLTTYAQRVDSSGAVVWPENGVPIATNVTEVPPVAIPDSDHGVITVWSDVRQGHPGDVYAQRIDSSGNMCWGMPGLALCDADSSQYGPVAVSDGLGGAVVAWYDLRPATPWPPSIYALRVLASGAISTSIGPPSSRFLSVGNVFPNPSDNAAEITYELSQATNVTMEVFDATGRRLRVDHLGLQPAGSQTYRYDGLDRLNHRLPSGVYFLRLHTEQGSVTRKLVLTR